MYVHHGIEREHANRQIRTKRQTIPESLRAKRVPPHPFLRLEQVLDDNSSYTKTESIAGENELNTGKQ